MPISAKALLDRIISVLVNPRRAAFAVAAGEAESPAIMLADGAITPAS